MNKIDVGQVKSSVDLRDLAGRYTVLSKKSGAEMAGACPKCGGHDRFVVDSTHFFCRECKPYGANGWWDSIEFVQWIGLASGFKAACEYLNGGTLPTVAGDVVKPAQPAKNERTEAQIQKWAIKAGQDAERAAVRLWEDAGRAGLEYLRGRGFTDDSLRAYGIGYEPNANYRGPSISIPWHDADGALVAVRYRHIEPGEDGPKITSRKGSKMAGYMHGLSHLRGRDALILVEGELNALSIIQATRGAVDVLSSGSESFTVTDEMAALIGSYAVRLVWMDKERIAVDTMAKIPGAYGFPSVGGYDANDWLKDGRLGELVRGLLEKAGAKVEPHAGPVVVGGFTIPGRVLGWFDTFSDAWGVASATGASIIREGLGVGKFLVWE